MGSEHDHQDRMLDRNLRRFAATIVLPPEPTAEQQRHWKLPPGRSVRPARGPSRLRVPWLAAFVSTLAASVAIYLMLVTAPGMNTVEASTILHDLRQRLFEGFQVTLENVGDEGLRIDGRLILGFAAPPPDAPDPVPARRTESLYLEARLRANEFQEARPFIDVETVAALRSDAQWIYFQLHSCSDWLLEKYPLALPLIYMGRRGVLLELDGFGQTLELIARMLRPAWVPSREPSRSPAPADAGPADIDDLLDNFIFGRADAAQVDRLVCLIAQSARSVRVHSPRSGRHVLKAEGLRTAGMSTAGGNAAKGGELVLEIVYEEGVGIESAVFRNVGLYRGTIRLTPSPPRADESLFDRQRLLRLGETTVWKLSDLDLILHNLLLELWSGAGGPAPQGA